MAHRVLIIGKRGMLGHMVEHVLASDAQFAVSSIGRAELDVTSDVSRALDALLSEVDYIINCIGVTTRHIDERDPISVARAIHVNAEFPHALTATAAQRGVRVIHMSTDGVFSGASSESYDESAVPDATDVYGRTKLLGESRAPNVLNVRCSIIGPSPVKREGLWEWLASQPEGATIQGYTNHLWHGVTTRQCAELCARIIREGRFDALRTDGHVLHYAPNAPCSKYELLCAIREALGKRLTIEPMRHTQSVRRVLAARAVALREMHGKPELIADAVRRCAEMVSPPPR